MSFVNRGASNRGSTPCDALVVGADGNFYGTTERGGANNEGTVFRLTPAGELTTLLEFSAKGKTNRGAHPFAALILGSDGDFYGSTFEGGAKNFGTIFRMTSAGKLTTLVEFTGNGTSNRGANPYAALIQGADGNFYGTTQEGGTLGYGTVFRMTPAGALTTLVDFTYSGATNRGAAPYAALVQGADGNFYGSTSEGGTLGYGTLFRMMPSGKLGTLLEFTNDGATNRGAFPYAALVVGADGHYYGTTSQGGDSGIGTIFRLRVKPVQ